MIVLSSYIKIIKIIVDIKIASFVPPDDFQEI